MVGPWVAERLRVPRHSDTNSPPVTCSCARAAANPAVTSAASYATLHSGCLPLHSPAVTQNWTQKAITTSRRSQRSFDLTSVPGCNDESSLTQNARKVKPKTAKKKKKTFWLNQWSSWNVNLATINAYCSFIFLLAQRKTSTSALCNATVLVRAKELKWQYIRRSTPWWEKKKLLPVPLLLYIENNHTFCSALMGSVCFSDT